MQGSLTPNSKSHREVWESGTQLDAPHSSVIVFNSNSRGRRAAWESLTTPQGATPNNGGPETQFKEPH